jgi:hypothetical protein
LLYPHRKPGHRLPAEAAARMSNQVGGQKPVQKVEDARIQISLIPSR